VRFASVEMADEMTHDAQHKRIHIAGTDLVVVFRERDADHCDLIGHVPCAFRAKTAILVPELGRYFLPVPRHGDKEAEVRVYEVVP
jgi:hypothetical protein